MGRSGAARAAGAAHRARGGPRPETLDAGFTTERDLGTEGAGYADVGLKQAINQGIVPGPRLLVATKANVARGAYGPKGFEPGVAIPQGAEEISGADEMTVPRATRSRRAPTSSRCTPTIIIGPRAEPPDHDRGRDGRGRRRRARRGPARRGPRDHRRGHAPRRSSPASTRSSTATAARPRCSS